MEFSRGGGGEEGLSREDLEPVMAGTVNGVWEKKSD